LAQYPAGRLQGRLTDEGRHRHGAVPQDTLRLPSDRPGDEHGLQVVDGRLAGTWPIEWLADGVSISPCCWLHQLRVLGVQVGECELMLTADVVVCGYWVAS